MGKIMHLVILKIKSHENRDIENHNENYLEWKLMKSKLNQYQIILKINLKIISMIIYVNMLNIYKQLILIVNL